MSIERCRCGWRPVGRRRSRGVARGSSPVLAVVLWASSLLALLVPGPGLGQSSSGRAGVARDDAVVHGQVTDSAGAPIAGALVELLPPRGEGVLRGVVTDGEGEYRLGGLAPGAYHLRVRQIGWVVREAEFEVRAGEVRRLDLVLLPSPVMIDSLVVESSLDARRERARFEDDAGITARVMTSTEVKRLPGLAEADVMRAVEVLPGVISTSDFSSAFNVRGGSTDQNLILLDGFPIFNPFHLGGLFSIFNTDVLARAELLAGGFGVEHGGRVSSVLNVETRDYAGEGFGGEAGVSLLAARLALHGALPSFGARAGGWFISGRRSYFDKVLPADLGLPYHLVDLQGGLTLGLPAGGRLRVTAYTGDDVLDMTDYERPPGDSDDDGAILKVAWRWGNDLVGLRWDQPWGEWVTTASVGRTAGRPPTLR